MKLTFFWQDWFSEMNCLLSTGIRPPWLSPFWAGYHNGLEKPRDPDLLSCSLAEDLGKTIGSEGKEYACVIGDKGDAVQSWLRKISWRRKWQPTLVFLPENSHDRGAWRDTVHGITKELDTTERTHWQMLEADWGSNPKWPASSFYDISQSTSIAS